MASEILIEAGALEAFVAALFRAAGSCEREAALTARHLVEANLRGHDSHGIGVIPSYLRYLAEGHLALNEAPEIVLDTGTLLVCDGRRGMGQVIAHDATDLAIARAKANGSCILALRNSFHIGRIGHWAEQCTAAGLVSLHFVNVVSNAAVAPFGGGQARLGTNPVAIGLPRADAPPIVVDFATSRLAVGKIRVAMNKGEQVPPGTLLDAQGRETTDPAALFASPPGALVTFGEHKGWGLALACELLAGALAGGDGHPGSREPKGIINGMFAILVSPERLGTQDAFACHLEQVVAWVTSEEGEDGPRVRVPGDPERATREARLRDGIPVDAVTWSEIREAAEGYGVAAPAS